MAQFPSQIQATILYDGPRDPDLTAAVDAFREAALAAGTRYAMVADSGPAGAYRLLGGNAVMVSIAISARPASTLSGPSADGSASSAPATPDAAAERAAQIAATASHVLVTVARDESPEADDDEGAFIERLEIARHLVLTIHRQTAATLVHWGPNDLWLAGATFAATANRRFMGPDSAYSLPIFAAPEVVAEAPATSLPSPSASPVSAYRAFAATSGTVDQGVAVAGIASRPVVIPAQSMLNAAERAAIDEEIEVMAARLRSRPRPASGLRRWLSLAGWR